MKRFSGRCSVSEERKQVGDRDQLRGHTTTARGRRRRCNKKQPYVVGQGGDVIKNKHSSWSCKWREVVDRRASGANEGTSLEPGIELEYAIETEGRVSLRAWSLSTHPPPPLAVRCMTNRQFKRDKMQLVALAREIII